jgi:ATP-dependent Lon protease
MEFYDAHFSLINQETLKEQFVSVTEQSGGKLIPEGLSKPGHVYAVTRGATDLIGVFKMELQVAGGSGKFERTGLGSNSKTKESLNMAFNYFKANSKNVSGNIGTTTKDFQLHVQNLQGLGIPDELTLAAFITLCSGALERHIQEQLVVLGSMTISGTITKVTELAHVLRVCFDAGAKHILLPVSSAADIPLVSAELFTKFQTSFYSDPVDAVFKTLGLG